MQFKSLTGYKSLATLGWRPFFQQQLTLEEYSLYFPVRVIEQHKSMITVASDAFVANVDLQHSMPEMVVGDWLLLDRDNHFYRLLDRSTCFKRKAAGSRVDWQLISANVDTAFIVCSLNANFNLNRIERYLSLVNEAGAQPVVVLSKSDLNPCAQDFASQVRHLDNSLCVEAVNCLDRDSVSKLHHWIGEGETIVVLGSSGVGKSTLINSLLGANKQKTNSIRKDDEKGRHTTTRRSLIPIPGGGLILDTPGMRAIQLADCRDGILTTFSDIEELAALCRYRDCQHQSEPGCAVQKAVEAGEIDRRRLENYLKLLKEEAFNSATLSEKRAKDKALGKFYKRTLTESYKQKGREFGSY
ncbi:ribosome small subunit-dependent GTPase A [Oxynema sp. CENA135]|uniref:ribosome small subunit-dependent GTPase A n=1 Tax=Oxynema sp. CENA135 TaxID=984206 RepID=UPI00190C9C85|nr:ribosome small subunit-dependent GTPase A [Oxynema sp. CENA135]MBK4729330.1 ribosome small subunit-dependent GTPase A [Oxynema sp. CENA135]